MSISEINETDSLTINEFVIYMWSKCNRLPTLRKEFKNTNLIYNTFDKADAFNCLLIKAINELLDSCESEDKQELESLKEIVKQFSEDFINPIVYRGNKSKTLSAFWTAMESYDLFLNGLLVYGYDIKKLRRTKL